MVYWKTAEALLRAVVTIRRRDVSMEKKIDALADLKALLELCEKEDSLSDLTAIYRDQKTETILGYDISAVEAFVGMMMVRYPGFRWMRDRQELYHKQLPCPCGRGDQCFREAAL